ncbi:MAG: NAD(P)-dependent oxidoreductase [Myxococcales bacterium]|nr:NAD(P)-dependent oxidoreductase [Myxococcales bacterium]
MHKIAVTGGSGEAGDFVVGELVDRGYAVRIIDRRAPPDRSVDYVLADLTNYADVERALRGSDAVVHFAADCRPEMDWLGGSDKFRNNVLATYNVFSVAVAQSLQKIVWASSSDAVFGSPYDQVGPESFPVTESHSRAPRSCGAISKIVGEELAGYFGRLYRIPIITLHLATILYTDPSRRDSYQRVVTYWDDVRSRMFNLWSYVDARDVALSARLALESSITGAESFIIAAADTIMNRPSKKLVAEVFPGIPVRVSLNEYESLLSTAKAQEMLGFYPQFSWRDEIEHNTLLTEVHYPFSALRP